MQNLYKLSEYFKNTISHLVNTDLEVTLLDKIFKNHDVKSVLDVACGVGRHAIPLSKKGYEVTGIDFSPYQIKKAKQSALKEKIKAKFLIKNANSFSFQKKFDAAICMWTTLGEEPMQYKKVIINVFKSLKKKGIFIIDNRSWEYIPKKREEIITNTTKSSDYKIIKTRIYDKYTENLRIRNVTSKIGQKTYKDLCITHLLKEKDWKNELKEAGFTKFEIYHNRKKRKIKKPTHVTIVAIK